MHATTTSIAGASEVAAYPTAENAPSRAARTLRTARYLSIAQIAARTRYLLLRRLYALAPARPIDAAWRTAAGAQAAQPLPSLPRELIAAEEDAIREARAAALARGRFSYLGRAADYPAGIDWRDPTVSPLWAFNLHYLRSVLDLALTSRSDVARRIFSAWAARFARRWDPVAWHPYPTSLRLTNLCLAAIHLRSFAVLAPGADALAATHAAYLLRHLERDLRGNHLLENACALLLASVCLRGPLARRCGAVARELLIAEVPEQVRADGSHFELSPMYHLLALERCLQALVLLDRNEPLAREILSPAVARMAGFLAGILCPDGDIPPIGDAVRGFAPPPAALLALAERFAAVRPVPPPTGVASFDDAGLHVFRAPRLWAIFDAGPVCADYLPGHGQADSLTVEVWCDGACVIGDPGVHEYTGPERAWGRSSRAHSTLTIDDADTSEVYGSFRVGGRARVATVVREPSSVTATLEPFGVAARLIRRIALATARGSLEITDRATAPAGRIVRSRLHLHPDVALVEGPTARRHSAIVRSAAGLVRIEAAQPLQVERGRASRQYGVIEPTTILVQTLAAAPDGNERGATFTIMPLGDGAR